MGSTRITLAPNWLNVMPHNGAATKLEDLDDGEIGQGAYVNCGPTRSKNRGEALSARRCTWFPARSAHLDD